MPRIHPRPEVLDGLIQLVPEARSRFLRHVRSCPSCRARAGGPAAAARSNVLAWPAAATEHGRVVDLVLAGLRPRLRAAVREREEAPALLSELLAHGPERREVLVRNSRRFRNLSLCGLLLRRGHQATPDAPRQAELLGSLALRLVDSLDSSWYGERVLADARGRCWTIIADARRAVADLGGAEAALRRAEAELRAGTGDPLEKARLLACKARLRTAQHRPDEAAGLLRRSVSIFLSAGELQSAAESIAFLILTGEHRGKSGPSSAAV